jgi:hydroxyacylglutathione hydrolase
VGLERVQGSLDGGMYAWHHAGLAVATIAQIPVDELRQQMGEGQDLQVVDVRQPGEYTSGHVPGAIHIPLARLAERVTQLRPERPTAVLCAGGYRSSAATGILARLGFRHLFNVVGGTSAWVNAGYPVETVRATTSL